MNIRIVKRNEDLILLDLIVKYKMTILYKDKTKEVKYSTSKDCINNLDKTNIRLINLDGKTEKSGYLPLAQFKI